MAGMTAVVRVAYLARMTSFPRKRESMDFMKMPCVHILASKPDGTLYIGVHFPFPVMTAALENARTGQ